MLRESEKDISEYKVHDLPISCEGGLVGGAEDLVDEGIGKLHEGHLSESLDEKQAWSFDSGKAVGEVLSAERNTVLFTMVIRREASWVIDHPRASKYY